MRGYAHARDRGTAHATKDGTTGPSDARRPKATRATRPGYRVSPFALSCNVSSPNGRHEGKRQDLAPGAFACGAFGRRCVSGLPIRRICCWKRWRVSPRREARQLRRRPNAAKDGAAGEQRYQREEQERGQILRLNFKGQDLTPVPLRLTPCGRHATHPTAASRGAPLDRGGKQSRRLSGPGGPTATVPLRTSQNPFDMLGSQSPGPGLPGTLCKTQGGFAYVPGGMRV